MEEEQLEWLENIIENSLDEVKIVQLHTPFIASFTQKVPGDII